MQVDKSYWEKELKPPYSPSDDDFYIYKNNLSKGETLLLGCTHKLISLSDYQMDIDPWYNAPTVIKQEWTTNQKFYTNIIGDGVLNFTEELTNKIIIMCQQNCKNFMARTFNKKLPNMKIADYFPLQSNFLIKPYMTIDFKDYNFFYWRF